MIRHARRSSYFNKETETYWIEVPIWETYKKIKFINWVFEINGKVYPFCTKEFKEEFDKTQMWRLLQSD